MKYYIGAYASSPNISSWDPELESNYYNQLKKLTNVQGLEHPFVGKLHARDDDWFLQNVDANWNFVFTCIPGIMEAKSANPHFGIASDDEAGRAEALDFMSKARDAIVKLNTHLGRQAVTAIQVQTSPSKNQASSSAAALQKSFETMVSWDWQGAQIVIEHCDAFVEGQKPAKGFLTLADELTAVQHVNSTKGSNIGIVINWGRSVIETRSVQGAITHIEQAKAAGVLSGLMFSGVSDKESEFGVWSDSHMPPALDDKELLSEHVSLMTEAEMHKCLAAADATTLNIVGVKIGIRPRSTNVDDRVIYNKNAFAAIDKFFS